MQLLNDLVGRKVTVFSIQGEAERQDVVNLEAFDGTWLRVKKGEEVMYFNTFHVRLVKPFDAH